MADTLLFIDHPLLPGHFDGFKDGIYRPWVRLKARDRISVETGKPGHVKTTVARDQAETATFWTPALRRFSALHTSRSH